MKAKFFRTLNVSIFVTWSFLTQCAWAETEAHSDSLATEAAMQTDDHEFAVAMNALADWRNSMESLDVEFNWRHPARPSRETIRHSHYKWRDWFVDGDCQHSKTVTVSIDENKQTAGHRPAVTGRTVTGRTGNFQYFAEYVPTATTPRLFTAVDNGPRKTMNFAEQLPLYPIYFATEGWFSGAFCQTPVEFGGIRMIHGHRCIGVKQSASRQPTLWLDPEFDYLPRLIESEKLATSWTWECKEFTKTNTGRWFPKRGVFVPDYGTLSHFEVTSVRMNQRMELSEFEIPKVSSSTFVRDMTRTGAPLQIEEPELVSAASLCAGQFSWWRVHLSFGMLASSIGWFRWRRRIEKFAISGSNLIQPCLAVRSECMADCFSQ